MVLTVKRYGSLNRKHSSSVWAINDSRYPSVLLLRELSFLFLFTLLFVRCKTDISEVLSELTVLKPSDEILLTLPSREI